MRRLTFLLLILCLTVNCFALQKNVASQKWTIFAFDRTDNSAKTGDLGQITGSIWIDGVENVIGDTNPTELAHGYYEFDIDQAETNGDYLVMDAVSSTGSIQVVGAPMAVWTTAPAINTLAISNARVNVDVTAISTDTTAADNLELQYDGTGLSGDKFPVRQDQLAAISGGLGVQVSASAVTISVDGGTETDSYTDTATHNNTLHIITDSGSGVGIEYYYTFNTGAYDNIPTNFHMHGWFEEGSAAYNNSCVIQAYNWSAAAFETIETLTHATAEEDHMLPLLVSHVSDGNVGNAGDVRIRFKITTQEAGSTVSIDHASVTYAVFVSAADVVEEWKTQSQSDPTDFHVNVLEVNGTAQTAGDIIAVIATAQSDLDIITGGSGVIIADGLLTAAKFGADFLTASKIADDAFAAEHFATNALTNDALDATWVTEILAVPFTDIGAGAPSATASWFVGLNRLYMAWLNKTITNGTNNEIEFYNFAGTKIAEAPISDDGTDFTRDKIGAVD